MKRLKRSDIPKDFEVQPLRSGQKAEEPATCGTCGLTWDDGKITGLTPTPGARCPFESFHVYENTTPPDTVAQDLQAVLDALRRHITSGDVAVFDDAAIPIVGHESFLVALPNKATFRIEIQQQAVPGNPPLNYCPCGRSLEKGATHCLACISTGKNQDRIPIVF